MEAAIEKADGNDRKCDMKAERLIRRLLAQNEAISREKRPDCKSSSSHEITGTAVIRKYQHNRIYLAGHKQRICRFVLLVIAAVGLCTFRVRVSNSNLLSSSCCVNQFLNSFFFSRFLLATKWKKNNQFQLLYNHQQYFPPLHHHRSHSTSTRTDYRNHFVRFVVIFPPSVSFPISPTLLLPPLTLLRLLLPLVLLLRLKVFISVLHTSLLLNGYTSTTNVTSPPLPSPAPPSSHDRNLFSRHNNINNSSNQMVN